MQKPSSEAYYRHLDAGKTPAHSLKLAGYKLTSPSSIRGMVSKLNARRAPAQNAPLEALARAEALIQGFGDEEETDPVLIAAWSHAELRESLGIISDTRHAQYGQPTPPGAWDKYMEAMIAEGAVKGAWIRGVWVEPGAAQLVQFPAISGPSQPPVESMGCGIREEAVLAPLSPEPLGCIAEPLPSESLHDPRGLPESFLEPDSSGLSPEHLAGLAASGWQDAPIERGVWTEGQGWKSDSDLRDELIDKVNEARNPGGWTDGW